MQWLAMQLKHVDALAVTHPQTASLQQLLLHYCHNPLMAKATHLS
jgi:hypothetical protein